MALPPRLEMACPRVACTVNYWICEKQHNCRQWSHTFCAFYILYRITQWGEGKSTSIMQSPAAYTLLVKLLTSTNDFLMIGPSIPQSCLLTYTHTHTHCTLHTFAPTHIHNDFYQGKYMWFNGSPQMPFPFMYCKAPRKCLFFPCY